MSPRSPRGARRLSFEEEEDEPQEEVPHPSPTRPSDDEQDAPRRSSTWHSTPNTNKFLELPPAIWMIQTAAILLLICGVAFGLGVYYARNYYYVCPGRLLQRWCDTAAAHTNVGHFPPVVPPPSPPPPHTPPPMIPPTLPPSPPPSPPPLLQPSRRLYHLPIEAAASRSAHPATVAVTAAASLATRPWHVPLSACTRTTLQFLRPLQ